jgi:D-alanyl-D-alanine carboxypeptidase (penicillin-binding protein 5/6)
MRARTVLAAALVAAVLAGRAAAAAPATPPDAFPQVARAYWVELDGRPLWAGAADARLPMASLTKLMTALLLVEQADLDGELVVGAGTGRETGTRIGLRPGERVVARDLFVAMMVRSANDACRALADWHGGDQATFVVAMNARARELGMADTSFADACGHDAPAQYSSARDLARLARAAMAHPEIVEAAARREHRFTTRGGRGFHVRSTNALLGRLDGARGLKTGYTPGAGRCLIALAERDGVEVLAVLLHAPDRWWDSVGLVELAFEEARRPTP